MDKNKFSYLDLINQSRNYFERLSKEQEFNENERPGVSITNGTNVVNEHTLRGIQSQTLRNTKEYLSRTFGPMGSNTKIVKGENQMTVNTVYSKDGLKVLKSIINSGPIEASIVEELIDITRNVEKEVGDGTTSTVILSSLIFDNLINLQKASKVPPYRLMKIFNDIVQDLKDIILGNGKETTVNDIYDISLISTNGNEEVAENIKSIYEEYGMDVDLQVGLSNSKDSFVKAYEGLTITEGMHGPEFINSREENICRIPNPKVYHFADPIDNVPMIELFETILAKNIYDPIMNDEDPIPTVITCPRISRDTSNLLKKLSQTLYEYDNADSSHMKPPILIVSGVVASDEIIMGDIATLCGCKSIRKYLDPEQHKRDIEKGEAPTPDNVVEFCGHCNMVISDAKRTKFINPDHMFKLVDGEEVEDPIYSAMIQYLEKEIEVGEAEDNANEQGLLKKRLAALKAKSVEYLVGGITVSDRDSLKDLVEDAVKNCRSASLYGVGYASNFEALRALRAYRMNHSRIRTSDPMEELKQNIIIALELAYFDVSYILYSTVETNEDKLKEYISKSVEKYQCPYNISYGDIREDDTENNQKVKCSIMLDINILDTISKIIGIMVTSNQCLLQSPQLNMY